jgi:hypothetical protein
MAVVLNEVNGGKQLEVKVSGKLVDEDYQRFVPEFERLVAQHGKIRPTGASGILQDPRAPGSEHEENGAGEQTGRVHRDTLRRAPIRRSYP